MLGPSWARRPRPQPQQSDRVRSGVGAAGRELLRSQESENLVQTGLSQQLYRAVLFSSF